MNYKYNDIINNLGNNKYYCEFFENSKSQREIIVLLPNNNTCAIVFDKNNDEINYIKFIKNNILPKHKEFINILRSTNNDIKKDIIGLFDSELDNNYDNIDEKYSKAYDVSSIEYLKNTFIPTKKVSAKYIINHQKQQNIFIKIYNNDTMELVYDKNCNFISLTIYKKEFCNNTINNLYPNSSEISIYSPYALSSDEVSIIIYELFFKK